MFHVLFELNVSEGCSGSRSRKDSWYGTHGASALSSLVCGHLLLKFQNVLHDLL